MKGARSAESPAISATTHSGVCLARCLLAERERTVTELENILSLRQPMVSQQLARLRLDQLVTTRRDGKAIYYSLANDDVRQVISVIYDIFCNRPESTDRLRD